MSLQTNPYYQTRQQISRYILIKWRKINRSLKMKGNKIIITSRSFMDILNYLFFLFPAIPRFSGVINSCTCVSFSCWKLEARPPRLRCCTIAYYDVIFVISLITFHQVTSHPLASSPFPKTNGIGNCLGALFRVSILAEIKQTSRGLKGR